MPHFKLMTNLQKLVAKCIRYASVPKINAFCACVPALLLAGFFLCQVGIAQAQPITLLGDQNTTMDISAASTMWIDAGGKATIAQMTDPRRAMTFTPSKPEAVYRLGYQSALWLHYRFAKQLDSREDWILEFPQPLIDRITVYQSTVAGSWTSQTAGDTIAVLKWPEPGRYAYFRLDLQETGVHDVYVQIRNVSNISVPVQVTSRGSSTQYLQMEYLMVGAVFGTLLLLTFTCLAQSFVYRDYTYGLYAAYACLLTLTMAAWTGVAGHMLWNNSGIWTDLAPGCLGVLTGSAALVFVTHLCGSSSRQKWFEPLAYALGFAGLPIAVIYALIERPTAVVMISTYLISVALLGTFKSTSTWQRRDIIGFWVLLAFAPLTAATLLLVASVMGLVPSSWLSRYGLLIGLSIEVPLLLIALNLRSRERHGVEARAQAISSQDALTGLLTAHLFQDRLNQIVARTKRYKEPAAVVFIELVNYRYIKKTWGVAVAEQSLLRSVIKLRRILRDTDTVGRVDEARFGLILEGASTRTPVTELGARLIAAGLMPLKGLKPEVVLQFHVVAVLLTERPGSATDISEALADLIKGMGSRTRRPIRFLEPESTRPMDLNAQSEFEPSQTSPRLRVVNTL